MLMTCQMFHQNYPLRTLLMTLVFFITGKNLKDMSNLMADQMKRVTDWFKINMLTLNVSKTNYMIMCNRGKMIADTECNIGIDGILPICFFYYFV